MGRHIAIPRNWLPGLRLDKLSGVGFLGGYVGEGVAAANLAGRTMADLILERQSDLISFLGLECDQESGSRNPCGGWEYVLAGALWGLLIHLRQKSRRQPS